MSFVYLISHNPYNEFQSYQKNRMNKNEIIFQIHYYHYYLTIRYHSIHHRSYQCVFISIVLFFVVDTSNYIVPSTDVCGIVIGSSTVCFCDLSCVLQSIFNLSFDLCGVVRGLSTIDFRYLLFNSLCLLYRCLILNLLIPFPMLVVRDNDICDVVVELSMVFFFVIFLVYITVNIQCRF